MLGALRIFSLLTFGAAICSCMSPSSSSQDQVITDESGSAKVGETCTRNEDCGVNGRCLGIEKSAEGFCQCQEGWTGIRCHVTNRCLNGGLAYGESECACVVGYAGPRCGFETELCWKDRDCRNGGTCDVINGEEPVGTCNCTSGWAGVHCSQPCSLDCNGRGDCVINPEDNSTRCECDEDFSGDRCQKRICKPGFHVFEGKCVDTDECARKGEEEACNVSVTSSTCVNTHGSYVCVIPPEECANHQEDLECPPDNDVCVFHEGAIKCGCPEGRSGTTCSLVAGTNCSLAPPCGSGKSCFECDGDDAAGEMCAGELRGHESGSFLICVDDEKRSDVISGGGGGLSAVTSAIVVTCALAAVAVAAGWGLMTWRRRRNTRGRYDVTEQGRQQQQQVVGCSNPAAVVVADE